MTDRERPRRSPADRARLDVVFGDTLPETTSDERRDGDPVRGDGWWHEQRPPHHA